MALTINSYPISISYAIFFVFFVCFIYGTLKNGIDFDIFNLSLAFFHYLIFLFILRIYAFMTLIFNFIVFFI